MHPVKKLFITACLVCLAVLFTPTVSFADTGKPIEGFEELLVSTKIKTIPLKVSTQTKKLKYKSKKCCTNTKNCIHKSENVYYRSGCKIRILRTDKTVTVTKYKKGAKKCSVTKKTSGTIKTYTYLLPTGSLLLGKDIGLKLPQKLVQRFSKDGFQVVLDPNISVNGLYSRKQKKITLVTFSNDTIYHEVGHYFADINHNIDTSKEFKKIFQKEKKKYKWSDKKYVTSCVEEYFAETFKRYFVDKKNLKKKLPLTYRYLDKQIKAYIKK